MTKKTTKGERNNKLRLVQITLNQTVFALNQTLTKDNKIQITLYKTLKKIQPNPNYIESNHNRIELNPNSN